MMDFDRKKALEKLLQEEEQQGQPSWKYRRRLIFTSFYLGVAMIVFAAGTFFFDTQVGVELIVGGVALITLVTGAYVGAATFEDVKLWGRSSYRRDEVWQRGAAKYDHDVDPDGYN
jgi:hypothetical protein